jgi:precorrin-4/cobalt-precorrin-4 C11-methyltransferase
MTRSKSSPHSIFEEVDMTKEREPVQFVGAGPGDPDLITVKGQQALARADLVIYAGSLVPEAVLKWARPDAGILDSAGMTLEEVVSEMERAWRAERRVVRLHTGDPSLYGAIFEQMAELNRRSIPSRIVPGVTAAFAAAAALGIEYTLPEVSQTLIITRMAGRTAVPEKETLASLAAHQASMAIYLSVGMIDQVAAVLQEAYGPSASCAVVYRASQPDETVVWSTLDRLVEAVEGAGIRRQAVIVVGRVLEVGFETLRHKSKLYDAGFSHGFRKGEGDSQRGSGSAP